MLKKQEIHILRQNAKIHKEIFEEIKKIFNFYFTSVYNSINEVEEDVASKILEKCKNIL